MTSPATPQARRLAPYAWFLATYAVRTRAWPQCAADGWKRVGCGTRAIPFTSLENSFYRGVLVALGLRESIADTHRARPNRDRLQLWVRHDQSGAVVGEGNRVSAFVLAYRINTLERSAQDRWALVVGERVTCPRSGPLDLEAMTSWLRAEREGAHPGAHQPRSRQNDQPEATGLEGQLEAIATAFFQGADLRPICTAKRRLHTIAVWWPRTEAEASDGDRTLIDMAVDLTARDPAPSQHLAKPRRQELERNHAIHWWTDWALVVHRENTGVACTEHVAENRARSIDSQYVLVYAWCALVRAVLVELMKKAAELGPPPQDGPKNAREEWERGAAKLRADVAAFRNRLWFPELTFNSALRRYHHILVEEFALRGLYADVADEIDMLDEEAQRRLNYTVNRLSEKGFALLMAGSFLGINVLIDPAKKMLYELLGTALVADLLIALLVLLCSVVMIRWWLGRPDTPPPRGIDKALRCRWNAGRTGRHAGSHASHPSTEDLGSGD